MQSTERRSFPHRRALVIVTTLAIAYMASHFFRASNVTIGLDLMRDLAIGPQALGGLTGAFFFGFAATQIPCRAIRKNSCGYALKRRGHLQGFSRVASRWSHAGRIAPPQRLYNRD